MREELRQRLDDLESQMSDRIKYGQNSPGYNQAVGAFDALTQLLEWLEENDGD